MRLPEQIEHLEYWWRDKDRPWRTYSHSRKDMKKTAHRIWRRWSKRNLEEDSLHPKYNTYKGWEY